MSIGDRVNLVEGTTPDNYHCDCEFCKKSIGELRPPGGGYYSRLERREYYDSSVESGVKSEKAHIAKTPLHIARWAIQTYSEPGDWILDPTIGAGTTAVEAITQGRNAAGMELQYSAALKANLKKNKREGVRTEIRVGDARRISSFLDDLGVEFSLVVNNPPYSGDEHAKAGKGKKGDGGDGPKMETATYKDNLPNLAFLKEGSEYFDTMAAIYTDCVEHLKTGGHFVTGIKDMMRAKKPFCLHADFCKLLTERVGLEFVGTAFLKHYPTTLFLNTYFKFYGVHPPYYQTINVFRKV
jgi:hypothetical protein